LEATFVGTLMAFCENIRLAVCQLDKTEFAAFNTFLLRATVFRASIRLVILKLHDV
jgi:hypothetical protein